MRRIVDDPDQRDPTLRVAVKMIRGVPPLNDALQRQRRVRLKLGSPSRQAAIWRAQPALLVLLLSMLSVAGASAMVDGGWHRTRERIVSWVHRETPARNPSLPARRSESRAAPPAFQATPLPLPAAPTPAAAVAAVAAVERQAPRNEGKNRVASREPPPAAKIASPLANEPARRTANLEADLMLEAIQARQAGDMRRTERLLTRSLAEFSDGVLQEEALALLIEAKAEHDRPAAETLARLYLQRFPDGRFRERVARGLRDTTTTR